MKKLVPCLRRDDVHQYVAVFTRACRTLCGSAFACCALAWSATASAATPFQARCQAASLQPNTTVATRDSGYRIDNTISYKALTTMKQPQVQGGVVLGLTRTESRVALAIDGDLLQDGRGAECVMPRIAVSLYYLPIVIYVGREFAPSTCAYRAILAHEMRHLKSYLETLPKVEEAVRTRLGGRYIGKPLYATAGGARDLLQRDVDANWMPFIKAEMGRVEQQQAAIDSPQEYARLSKICQGEVQSIIRPARRPRS